MKSESSSSVEVHSILLQKVIIVAEVRIQISLDVFTLIFLFLGCKLSFLLLDGLLEVGYLLAKTGDGGILLCTLATKRLAILDEQCESMGLLVSNGTVLVG